MTWKQVTNSDAGDADHFGGNDFDKISQLFSATSAVDTVDINSDWTFRNNRMFVRNPANTFSYQFTAAAIAANRVITLPLLTAGDTLVTEAFAQTLTTKTMSASSNTFSGLTQMPTIKRTGFHQPAAGNTATTIGASTGCLDQHVGTGAGSNSNTFDTTEGVLMSYVSGATAGNNAGLITPTNGGVGIGRRLFGLRMVARFSVTSTTNGRCFCGFTSATAPPNNAQPLAVADHGIGVGWNETGSGSTNWSIFHNDGATSATVDNVTGPVAKDTAFHTIEINWAASGNPNVIFDGTSQSVSTDLPATTANLFFNCYAQASTTTAKTLLLKGIWIEVDK
jgi:hypothetical protein